MSTAPFLNTPEDDWHTLAPRPWSSLSDDEKLRRLRATFHFAVIGEMHRSLPCIKIGTALLAFCALDFLGALAAGRSASQKTFKAFCATYLLPVDQRYNCDRLWKARCRLVHTYSMQDGYFITWRQTDVLAVHLRRLPGTPGPILELEQFVADIDSAGEALFVDALSDTTLQAKIRALADAAPPTGFGTALIQYQAPMVYP